MVRRLAVGSKLRGVYVHAGISIPVSIWIPVSKRSGDLCHGGICRFECFEFGRQLKRRVLECRFRRFLKRRRCDHGRWSAGSCQPTTKCKPIARPSSRQAWAESAAIKKSGQATKELSFVAY